MKDKSIVARDGDTRSARIYANIDANSRYLTYSAAARNVRRLNASNLQKKRHGAEQQNALVGRVRLDCSPTTRGDSAYPSPVTI